MPSEFYVALYNQRQGAQVPKQLRRAIQRPRARPHSQANAREIIK